MKDQPRPVKFWQVPFRIMTGELLSDAVHLEKDLFRNKFRFPTDQPSGLPLQGIIHLPGEAFRDRIPIILKIIMVNWNVRYRNGELENADSNKFADSLKYTTPGGKTVYGGGGIMPDIFVPIDTIGVSDYFIDVRNQGLIYRYSLKYADENRKLLSVIENTRRICEYSGKTECAAEVYILCRKRRSERSARDIRTSEKILKVQLYAYIARNFLDNDGFYPIIQDIDNTLLKTVDNLSN